MVRLIRENNFTPANLRKLRQYAGVLTTQQLINTAGREINLGVRPDTQRRRALNYWRELHNDAVEQVREANRIARNEVRRSNARVDRIIRTIRNSPMDRETRVDIRNNREGTRLIQGLRGTRLLMGVGGTFVTLTPQNSDELLGAFDRDDFYTEEMGAEDSWKAAARSAVSTGAVSFTPVAAGAGTIGGAFFSFKHKIPDLNLERQQIYHQSIATTVEDDSCFVHALNMYGVPNLDNVRQMVCKRDMSMNTIKKVAELLGVHITVRRVEDSKHLKHYGDRTREPINLGLIEAHYFLIETTQVTTYALKNYHELKHLERWNEVRAIRSNGLPDYSPSRFASSYDVVKVLLENKDTLLYPIPQEELYSSHYYKTNKELTSLDFGDKQFAENFCGAGKDEDWVDDFQNVFFDYETTTDGDIHEEYLVRCSCIEKVFLGKDCGRQMLYALAGMFPDKKLRLIAHNAAYDFRFIMKHLSAIKPITRGKMLLKAQAKFFYAKGKSIDIEIQDSYALIPDKLANFGKMFNLDVCKEILPYGLYTKANVGKRLIPDDECIVACKNQFRSNNIGNTQDTKYRLGEKQFIKDFFANVNKWKCGVNGLVDIIKYSSIYCKMDCEVLDKGYNTFRAWILEACHLNINRFISLPSLADAYLLTQGVYEGTFRVSCVVREFIQRAMVGGRTMCAENKKHHIKNQPLDDFDAVSLYPSAMKRLGGYLLGKPKILETTDYAVLQYYDGYFVEILITDVGKHYKFPLMSVRNEDGIRNFTNDMVGQKIVVDKTTLEDLIHFQKVSFEIIRGYYYNEGRNPKLADTIEYLFEKRLQAKKEGNPIQAVYKLLMNSAYGKTLLKPIEDETKFVPEKDYEKYIVKHYNEIKEIVPLPNGREYVIKLYKSINEHFNNCTCGVEVLSMSKRIMNEVMCLAEDLRIDIYYQDTDSMHITSNKVTVLSDAYRELYHRELIGKDMGQFHTDFDSKIIKGDIVAKESIFLGKKCYLDVLSGEDGSVDYHIRMKGVSAAAIHYYTEQNNISLVDLYTRLYDGERIEFDLCCGGDACAFEFHKNMTISSREKFCRQICF